MVGPTEVGAIWVWGNEIGWDDFCGVGDAGGWPH